MTEEVEDVVARERIAALDRLLLAEVRRLDDALEAQDRATDLLNTTNQIAQNKFEATVERDSVKQNEFRGALDDLSKLMATRRETEASFASVVARQEDFGRQLGDLRSRIDIGPAALATLQAQQNQQTGRQQGIQTATTNAYYVLALIAAIVGGLLGHFVK